MDKNIFIIYPLTRIRIHSFTMPILFVRMRRQDFVALKICRFRSFTFLS